MVSWYRSLPDVAGRKATLRPWFWELAPHRPSGLSVPCGQSHRLPKLRWKGMVTATAVMTAADACIQGWMEYGFHIGSAFPGGFPVGNGRNESAHMAHAMLRGTRGMPGDFFQSA